jgi:hypothetical protein
MESGPIGPYLSEIAALLHRNGYARSTIRRHLRAADRFGAWILKEGMSIVDINASIVDRYLEGLGRQFFPSRLGGTLPDKASGLRQMVEMLSQQGVLRPDAKEQPPIGISRCVADFDHHLDQVRGNGPRTRKIYLWYARRFLLERFGAEDLSILGRWPSPRNHERLAGFVVGDAVSIVVLYGSFEIIRDAALELLDLSVCLPEHKTVRTDKNES